MATITVQIEMPGISRENILKRNMIVFDKSSKRYFMELDSQHACATKDGTIYLPFVRIVDGSEITSEEFPGGELLVEQDQIVLGRVKKAYIPNVKFV